MTVCYKCQGNWQTSPRHICIYDHRTRGSTWVKHCYGLVPLRRSSVATDAADILEQGIGSSSPAEDGRALIEHIIQCMYNLYGPSWGPVTTFGYVITDSRIYPPPPPPAGRPWDAHLRIKMSPAISTRYSPPSSEERERSGADCD